MSNSRKELFENIETHTLDISDTFDFKCRGCGKCCRQRDDILLSPKDLFKLVMYTNMTYEDFIGDNCEIYIGSTSRMPLIRLISVGGNRRCPFLEDRKCRVHDAKPTVCAMYPIGRYIGSQKSKTSTEEYTPMQQGYLLVPTDCGHRHKTQTVREWLERLDIPHPDEYYRRWTTIFSKGSEFFNTLERYKVTEKPVEALWNVVFQILYVEYDAAAEFEPQFERNILKLENLIAEVGKLADMRFPKPEEGATNGCK